MAYIVGLIHLKPGWETPSQLDIPDKFYAGVSFLCPHCDVSLPENGTNKRRRIYVGFWPPIDPDGLLDNVFKLARPPEAWERAAGDTFETLTLFRSINVSGHWHGFIHNGKCIGA